MKFICSYCSKEFERSKRNAHHSTKLGCKPYCSRLCVGKAKTEQNTTLIICANCGTQLKKRNTDLTKVKNSFCNSSCAATYNNSHKTHGYRRSKLEKYLEDQLTSIYSTLEFHFNRKDAIQSELDIYIPSLNLAFELNGIFHYEPIYGQDTLDKINNNDQRKFQACLEHGIELCIIDTSSQKYFKESTSRKFLDIICQLINSKLCC